MNRAPAVAALAILTALAACVAPALAEEPTTEAQQEDLEDDEYDDDDEEGAEANPSKTAPELPPVVLKAYQPVAADIVRDLGGGTTTEGAALPPVPTPHAPEGAALSPEGVETSRTGPSQEPLTMEQSQALVQKAGARAAANSFTPDVPDGGCFARAHYYEEAARAEGYQPLRAQVVAGTEAIAQRGEGLSFDYHTTMALPVKGDDGTTRMMAFDPALDPKNPIPLDRWAASEVGGARSYHRDDVPVAPGQYQTSVVTLAPGSTTDSRSFFPPYSRVPAPEGAEVQARRLANRAYEQVLPNRGATQVNPQRYVWTNGPGRTGK